MKQISNYILVSAICFSVLFFGVYSFGVYSFGVQEGDAKPDVKAAEKSEAEPEVDSPAAKLKAIKKEAAKIMEKQSEQVGKLNEKLGGDAEKIQKEFVKISKQSSEKTNEVLKGAIDIAKMVEKDKETSLDAAIYVLSRSTDEAQQELATDLLIKHHIDGKSFSRKFESVHFQGLPSKSMKSFFEKIIANANNDQLKGMAELSLASHFMELNTLTPAFENNETFAAVQPEAAKYIKAMKEEVKFDKLKLRFEKIAEDYEKVELPAPMRILSVQAKQGDLIGEIATRVFKNHETKVKARTRIVVGKQAPEIEGPDLDGETFKLSDYRGKVVLLDFWGDW